MEIRAYTRKDRLACLRVLDSNIPGFFKPEARDDFTDYLDELGNPGHTFFVLENYTKQLIACAGIYVFPDATLASLHWIMVARAHQHTEIGRTLLEHQLNWIRQTQTTVQQVVLSTHQGSSGFFERFGFVVENISENFYGTVIHRLEMRLILNP
jgi:ribosomal protein S18 acetylase RimI-like enzyme